jgi:hypothetical protein
MLGTPEIGDRDGGWLIARLPMSSQRPLEEARQSLTAHAAAKGAEIRAKYGPKIDWEAILRILDDRECVRYPCTLVFDAKPLLPGEFAQPLALGERPEDGFALYLHPLFVHRTDELPYLVLYQLVLVNYGEFASSDDAEVFGASVLGLTREVYYQAVCRMADKVAAFSSSGTEA